jgi:hypothetical protein
VLLDALDEVKSLVERVEELAIEAGDSLAQPLQLRVDSLVRPGIMRGRSPARVRAPGSSP